MNEKDAKMFREKLHITGNLFALAEHRKTGIIEIVHIDTIHGITPSELDACPTCKDMPEDSDLADELRKIKYSIN